jgi:hypothetical protein
MPIAGTPVVPAAAVHAVSQQPLQIVWTVRLPNHPPYEFVNLRRVFTEAGSRHEVVVVHVGKLLACAERDDTDYVLKPVDDWHAGKVKGIRDFLDPANPRVPEMPYVTIGARRTQSLLGWFGVEREGVVAFRNGQHRMRYLAYAGAVCVPVEVHEREAALLRRMCSGEGPVG